MRQRIGNVMVVEDVHAAHAKAGPLAVKVSLDRIGAHWDPEYIVPVNVNVVIMDLFIDAGRSNRTGVSVQSNKGECASMLLAVCTNKLALAEPHVRLKRKPVMAPLVVSVPIPPPRMCVRPTNPSKSVICDGSLMSASAWQDSEDYGG